MPRAVWVDDRWFGHGGIGRFAQEVARRLPFEWRSLRGPDPFSPLDSVNPHRLVLGSSETVFSPGYNAGLGRCRQVLTVHDLMHLRSERSAAKAAYYATLVRRTVERTGVVLTVSDVTRELLLEWLADDRVSVVNVGNGTSMALHGPKEFEPTRKALFVGGTKAHKRLDVALAALEKLTDWELVVVTAEPESVTRMVAATSAAGRVIVRSRLSEDELRVAYREASVLFMPSVEEGFGFPAVEALACQTPVVYWSGCRALTANIGPFGVGVDSLDDVDLWVDAARDLDGLPDLSSKGDLVQWYSQFNWDRVAARVAHEVQLVQTQ